MRQLNGAAALTAMVMLPVAAPSPSLADDRHRGYLAQKPSPGWSQGAGSRADAGIGTTCFGPQVVSSPGDDLLSRASVIIKSVTREGRTVALGTGTIIRNSANEAIPRNRILTAYHVTQIAPLPDLDGMKLAVVGSDGVSLGEATIVERAQIRRDFAVPTSIANAYASFSGHTVATTGASADMVVLAMTSPPPEGWASYDQREGIELSSRQDGQMLTGLFSEPGGLDKGASGAGVVDDTDRLMGVVLATLMHDGATTPATKLIPAQNGLVRNGDQTMIGYTGAGAVLASAARAYILPVVDKGVIAALNGAVRNIHVIDDPKPGLSQGVRIAAYPYANCIVYRGLVEVWNPNDEYLHSNMTLTEFHARRGHGRPLPTRGAAGPTAPAAIQ